MPSVNIRQLRDSKRIKEWLRTGKTVIVRDRNTVIGRLVPEQKQDIPAAWPDFAARQKAIFGDRVLNAVDDFLKYRHRDMEP